MHIPALAPPLNGAELPVNDLGVWPRLPELPLVKPLVKRGGQDPGGAPAKRVEPTRLTLPWWW